MRKISHQAPPITQIAPTSIVQYESEGLSDSKQPTPGAIKTSTEYNNSYNAFYTDD